MDNFPFLSEEQRLAYVALPDDIPQDLLEIKLQAHIPLPILLKDKGREGEQIQFNWDQVLQGVLHILAHQPQHQYNAYYRSLAFAIQPQLSHHLLQVSRQQRDEFCWEPAQQLLYLLLALHPEELWPQLELGFLYEQALRICQQREERGEHWTGLANVLYDRVTKHPQLNSKACYQILFYYLNQQQYSRLYSFLKLHLPLLADTEGEAMPALGLAELEHLTQQLEPFKPGRPAQRALQHYFDAEYQQANQLLEQQNDSSVFVQQLHAIQLYHLHRYSQAKDLLEPLCTQVHFPRLAPYLALCCEQMELWEQAKDHWLRLLKSDGENVQAIHHLALIARQQGRAQEAESFWQSLACFDPSFPQLEQHLREASA